MVSLFHFPIALIDVSSLHFGCKFFVQAYGWTWYRFEKLLQKFRNHNHFLVAAPYLKLCEALYLHFFLNMLFALHEKKNFRLMKICEKCRKDHIFVCFRMFQFHGNIIFSELSFKRKRKKAASFRKCVFLRKSEIFVYDSLYCNENKRFFAGIYVNFSLTIFKRKDEIFCHITAKTSHWSTFRWRCLYFSDNILRETWS